MLLRFLYNENMIHMLYSHQSQKLLKHTVKEKSTPNGLQLKKKRKAHNNVIRGRTGKILL